MRHYCTVLVLLISTMALAQAAKPAPKPQTAQPPQPGKLAPSTPAATAAEVPPTAPVITINGLCATKPAVGGECKTVVTRAQFDKLLQALAPPGQVVSPQIKRQFAQQYTRLMIAAVTAEKDGLANNPDTQTLIQFARMQALAQEFQRSMAQKAMPTDADAKKYYDENQKRFTQYTFDRILVPVTPNKEGAKPEDMKAFAEQLRERAAKAEDFKTLQKEAFEKAGLTTPPETRVVIQPDSLPPSQQSVLTLKPGEVSQVIQDPGGIYIYKMISEQPVPFDKVSAEIKQALQRQKMQQEGDALMNSVQPELNPQFFGEAAGGPGTTGAPGARPGTPPPAGTPTTTPPKKP